MARGSQHGMAAALVAVVMLLAVSMACAEEVAPTMAERLEAMKALGTEKAAQMKGALNTWKDWTAKRATEWTNVRREQTDGAKGAAKEYAAKAAETLQTSTVQTHEAVSGMFSKWNAWAKQAAEKVYPTGKLKNPAAEAADYINRHRPKSLEYTEDEL